MKLLPLQFFVVVNFLLITTSSQADLNVGQVYALSFVDVDGNKCSTSDGHMTVVVLTTSTTLDKARAVGDRIPDYCLGNPAFRMITIVNFQKKRFATTRAILRGLIRRRLDSEAERLRNRYAALKINREARRDVFAVPDFDGSIVTQLGTRFESGDFRVFIFGRNGTLAKTWDDVPSAQEMRGVLKGD